MVSGLLDALPERAWAHLAAHGRPLVTLSYAQSLDGCLTLHAGQPSPVSGAESMRLTHRLRVAHDAILVGIGTVLADDPRLTARVEGACQPQPVVLDSRLRFPVSARLLAHPRGPWLATTQGADAARAAELEAAGATVLPLPAGPEGRVSLGALLGELGARQITSVMVEGGAGVITAFLRAGLADVMVVTIAPVLAGGYHAVQGPCADEWAALPRLSAMSVERAGEDVIVWGDIMKGASA